MKKILYLFLAVTMFSCSDDEGNPCVYEPTLTTQAATDITETSATLNGTIDVYSQNCDNVENILQGFVYSISSEPTIDDNIVNLDGTSISEVITGLEPNTTYYARVFLVRPLIGIFYGNEVSFVTEDSIDDCDVVYLDDNGVTIKAYPCANIGDVGIVNGVEYTVVDRAMLVQMVGREGSSSGFPNVTKLCTTRVIDMSYLFWDCVDMQFNQPIGNWDVSNVTTMEYMFSPECGRAEKEFNQDISNWDVSNVTNMSGLFSNNPYFNQDISNWNTSSVTNMRGMFYNANSFNQDIRNWDVSNVNNMGYMFYGNLAFNQDISSWNVSSVTDMSFMFYDNGELNAPIGNWDVSNVTNMQSMFENNQEINQDLSSWAVDNVTQCSFFSDNTPQWTLPQPNFTNCNP
jgi:surface protein